MYLHIDQVEMAQPKTRFDSPFAPVVQFQRWHFLVHSIWVLLYELMYCFVAKDKYLYLSKPIEVEKVDWEEVVNLMHSLDQ